MTTVPARAETPAPAPGPRRSLLAQDRSRRTREALIGTAVRAWGEAGYDNVSVADITQAAGVTKRTFYVHFASKDDILAQLNRETESAMVAAAVRATEAGQPVDAALDQAALALDEQSGSRPRALMAHIVREYHQDPGLARQQSAFRQLLPDLFERARQQGQLPAGVQPERLAVLAAAIIYSACQAWAEGRSANLYDDLRYGLRVLLAGVRATPSDRTEGR